MKTILDESDSWILDRLEYTDVLFIYLRELKRGKPQKLKIGSGVIEGASPLKSNESSISSVIKFPDTLSWQRVDESATTDFKGDKFDEPGFICKATKSRYLDFILENHGWFQEIRGISVQHYRIWSEDDVIDVISFGEPEVSIINA